MSAENFQQFLVKVTADPALQAKVHEVLATTKGDDFGVGLAALSDEQQLPVSAEEFCERGRAAFSSELNLAQLDSISGGNYTTKNFKSPFDP